MSDGKEPLLRLQDTRAGKKVDFVPLQPGKVGIYVCGVTVYDDCHIGHARTLVAFDVIVRHLRSLGLEVRFVRNITDVDDKIIRRSANPKTSSPACEVGAVRPEEIRKPDAELP
jgi:cysteinyl-tRNA synthetase